MDESLLVGVSVRTLTVPILGMWRVTRIESDLWVGVGDGVLPLVPILGNLGLYSLLGLGDLRLP